MNHSRLLLATCLLSVCSLLACAKGDAGPPATGDVNAEEARCESDKDCTLIDDCCGCEQGGMQVGVHVDNIELTRARQETECQQRTCPGTASAHRSCDATGARCLGGRCIPML